jgi:uncharacterized protein (DUF302 family)
MRRWLKRIGVSLFAVAAIAHADNTRAPYVIYETEGKYADVLDELNQAIINRGLVVGTTSRVQEMLARTGKDLGGRSVLYENADVLQFCSAVLSRKAMEADPRNIIFCPYGIAVWTEAGKPERVFVGYRRTEAPSSPQSAAALKEVEKLLDDIVREAIGR